MNFQIKLFRSLPIIACALVVGMLASCATDGDSSEKSPGGVMTFPTLYSWLNQTKLLGYLGGECLSGPFDLDTTVAMNLPSNQFNLSFRFGCDRNYYPDCNINGISVKVDGKPIDIQYGSFYGRDTSVQIILPDYTNEHFIEWSLDSTTCGHVRGSYRMVPSDEPGDYIIPDGDKFANNTAFISSYDNFKKGTLFFDVISEIQWRDHDWIYEYAYGDSLQSDCIAVSGEDTLHLPISFVPNENIMLRPTAHIDPDNGKVADFMGDDTVATIACGMVYQSWIVPKKVDDFEYKRGKKVHFVQEYGDHLFQVDCADDLICFKGELARLDWVRDGNGWYYGISSFAVAKTSKDDLIFKRIPVTGLEEGRFIFEESDLIDESGDTLSFDYVQLVAFPLRGSHEPLVSSRESAMVLRDVDKLCDSTGCNADKWINDRDASMKMDSLINLVVDEKGNPKDGLWLMAKRIGPLMIKK